MEVIVCEGAWVNVLYMYIYPYCWVFFLSTESTFLKHLVALSIFYYML